MKAGFVDWSISWHYQLMPGLILSVRPSQTWCRKILGKNALNDAFWASSGLLDDRTTAAAVPHAPVPRYLAGHVERQMRLVILSCSERPPFTADYQYEISYYQVAPGSSRPPAIIRLGTILTLAPRFVLSSKGSLLPTSKFVFVLQQDHFQFRRRPLSLISNSPGIRLSY